MTEIEEAVARLRRHAVEAYGDLEDDLLFAIEALSASQAEVERLRRERGEAGALAAWVRKRNCDTPQEAEAWHGKMLDRIEAAEARATRAEGLLEEAGEVLGHAANEWADMATSGIQWLRNVRDGISTPEQALENMAECLAHCQAVSAAARAFLAKLKEQG